MIRVGDIEIYLINDGNILVDSGGPFGLVPRVLWSNHIAPVWENLIPMTLTCLLVRVDGKNVVVDTGYGTKEDEKLERIFHLDRTEGDLIDGLARLDVSPEDVDLVINTHLHYDHAGGNTYRDEDGEIYPTFPQAQYVVQGREYKDATRPNERTRATYLLENYVPLVRSGHMRLLYGNTEFFPGVRGVVTPGHTPGHMSVLFERDGDTAMFVCDLASYAVHMERLSWMTAYDVHPLETLETKRLWRGWARERDAVLIFPHDPSRYAGRLIGREDKPILESIDEGFA